MKNGMKGFLLALCFVAMIAGGLSCGSTAQDSTSSEDGDADEGSGRVAPSEFFILVFGSLEPEINQTIADFLNLETDMSVDTTSDDTDINSDNLQNYNVVIDYDHDTINSSQEEALREFVSGGGKLIGLHHAIYDPEEIMLIKREIYGAYLPFHCCQVEPEAYQVILTSPDSPVFEGLETTGTILYSSDFISLGTYPFFELPVLDERYTEIVFLEDKGVNILLSTIFEGTNYDIGWYREEGEGLVFYYQMGHLEDMFSVPWYQDLIIQTIRYYP